MDKIIIDGETLFISGVGNTDPNHYADNSIGDLLHLDSFSKALKPIVNISKSLKNSLQEIKPDEIELTLQLQLAVSENTIALAMVNAGAEAHLSVKFVWKKD